MMQENPTSPVYGQAMQPEVGSMKMGTALYVGTVRYLGFLAWWCPVDHDHFTRHEARKCARAALDSAPSVLGEPG